MKPVAPATVHAPLLLLTATFFIAVSGLVYELLTGTLSSYLLGDSVYQFSLVIGLFMTAMGLGAYFSRFIQSKLSLAFIQIQMLLALTGGLSAPFLFYAFTYLDNYSAFLWLSCILTGSLIGLEIPLIIRILQHYQILKLNISNVLTADYIGALAAALLFPLVLVPQLGLMRTSLLFGLLNLLVAALAVWIFHTDIIIRQRLKMIVTEVVLIATVLGSAMVYSEQLLQFFELRLYQDEVLFARSTPYQRLVVTRKGPRFRLFINGNLQFDSLDEYRYHESLVHPAMSLSRQRQQVLILGGGDGMAVREVLKYPDVAQVTLVDLDPTMTDLFRDNPLLKQLNDKSLSHPKVKVVNADAWQYLQQSQAFYNVIIIDLPDPHHISLSKLYSQAFYHLLSQHLARDGMLVTQATSPFYARTAFWCIAHTLAASKDALSHENTLYTQAYHNYVPSFGEWGFVLASHQQIFWETANFQQQLPENLRYLNTHVLENAIIFPPDMQELETEVNRLQQHPLLRYYETAWTQWFPS
ncbi:polyamine aminopropyltransferase [Candidatus Venteria ishoeyi]|uniref:Polyamine aminopropyltransferase n=1 Tax=Candidatus Venteria ishoeyi TaxID=1899563 RepID=A0A1H6FAW9_9GAMM|nr:polyamine aminopropyltransferase [Candidatus Venteria ishoeyi]SEH07242.1 Spermidine synthase [Candidatus Venteria ishoeyi]